MSSISYQLSHSRTLQTVILFAAGAIWGATIPASKVVISSGFPIMGVLFWQCILVALVTGLIALFQGARLRVTRQLLMLMAIIGAFGTLFPGIFGYIAVDHLPAGVMAITVSLVPIFVMPIAVLLGKEILALRRILGVILGALAIILLVGPETSLPDPAKAAFVFLAMLSPLSYAIEDNCVAYFGIEDQPAALVLCGAMVLVFCCIAPVTLLRGDFFWLGAQGGSEAEIALVFMNVMHAIAYATFIWLIGVTGPVFTSIVAYLVTLFGVLWSILYLGESYSTWIWGSLILMLAAMFLVRPHHTNA